MKISPGLHDLLASQDIKGELFSSGDARKKKENRYFQLMRGINILSHSTSERLITCERKFACSKLEQNNAFDPSVEYLEGNIDFAFGRAIETGVHASLLGHPSHKIFFDMFLAWDIPLMQEHPRNYAKRFVDAWLAIEQFLYIKKELMQGWEIAMFNGKPAIELSFVVDLENNYYYAGHVDVVLFHPELRRYRVLEIKTTGIKNLHEAMYKNSGQALGYSILLDSIARDVETTATFEVFYLVFPTSIGFWKLYDFVKSRSNRATWINTVLLDIQRVNTYRTLAFWPKRGSSCMAWNRPCEYFDRCDMDASAFNPTGDFAIVTPMEIEEHEFDFRYKLSEILETQKELLR